MNNLTREKINDIQTEKLKKIVKYVYENVPFYKQKFNEIGLMPEDIKSLEDVKLLPFTTKQDLRDTFPYGMFATPMNKIIRIHASSGTTGTQTIVGYTKKDINRWAELIATTLQRYGAEITISGQHQLEHFKRLFLYFCRMEESLEGVSINEMKDILVEAGYDEGKLEIELERQGFERGASIRNKKYKVLEKRKYEVDDSFPRITKETFKGDRYPDAITHIEYTVDLDGIGYTTW